MKSGNSFEAPFTLAAVAPSGFLLRDCDRASEVTVLATSPTQDWVNETSGAGRSDVQLVYARGPTYWPSLEV